MHLITSMERGETKGSQSPMWRCTTNDGETVFVFQHSDTAKNSARFLIAAGYGPEMLALQLRESLTWRQHPIQVELMKDGQWWRLIGVEERPADAQPDPRFVPDLPWYKCKAQIHAQFLFEHYKTIIFDTETNGTGPDAEIISLGVLDRFGDTLAHTLVKPLNMAAVEQTYSVHGLGPNDLEDAPSWPAAWRAVTDTFRFAQWVAYNVQFDSQMIYQNCMRHGIGPIIPAGLHDAMQMYSEFAGLWDVNAQKWKWAKLSEAAEASGIAVENAHDALADAQTLYKLMRRMAQ